MESSPACLEACLTIHGRCIIRASDDNPQDMYHSCNDAFLFNAIMGCTLDHNIAIRAAYKCHLQFVH